MDMAELIQPGMVEEFKFRVEEHQTAGQVGSGSLRVLATPVMIGMMERCSHQLLAHHLDEGLTSVGIQVIVRHLAPTPCGAEVRIRSEVTAVEGSKVTFRIQAWDPVEQVGEGEHQRAVIDQARFLRRVAAKIEQVGSGC